MVSFSAVRAEHIGGVYQREVPCTGLFWHVAQCDLPASGSLRSLYDGRKWLQEQDHMVTLCARG